MTSETDNDNIVNLPLFGETKHRDRISFLIITIITTIFVVITFGSIFFSDCFKIIYIFLSLCLFLLLGSHLCLKFFIKAFWYRTGDLEPRFRNMLYYNTAAIICLCICSNIIISGKYTCPYERQCYNNSGKHH